MPLADIRAVSKLPAAQAATELAAYWAQVEAETSARRELAVFLIGYLSGKDTAMHDGQETLTVADWVPRRTTVGAEFRQVPARA